MSERDLARTFWVKAVIAGDTDLSFADWWWNVGRHQYAAEMTARSAS